MRRYHIYKIVCWIILLFLNKNSVIHAANWSPLVDTGQTACYTNQYPAGVIPCPNPGSELYGQDGNYLSKQPSYTAKTLNGGAIVVDNNTGLVWTRTPRDTNRDGIISDYDKQNYMDASDYCSNLNYAGRTNWRLPNLFELFSIVDITKSNPSSDPIFQPLYDGTGYYYDNYWSSTTERPASREDIYWGYNKAWGVSFSDGFITHGAFTQLRHSLYVRCVSGVETRNTGPYTMIKSGVILDQATGFLWMKYPVDRDGNNIIDSRDKMPWDDSLQWCENSKLGGFTDWRLPNIREFVSIIDVTHYDYYTYQKRVNPVFITATEYDTYHSSTNFAPLPTWQYTSGHGNYGMGFHNGDFDFADSDRQALVRCVRGGVPPPPPIPIGAKIAPIVFLLLTE